MRSLLTVVFLLGTGPAYASLVIDEWAITAIAQDGNAEGGDSFPLLLPDLPFDGSLGAIVADSHAKASFEADIAGHFQLDVDLARSARRGSNAFVFGFLLFHVNAPRYFNTSGNLTMMGPGELTLQVDLSERYRSSQQSRSSPDASLVVGGLDGDHKNELSGTLPTLLEPGNQYEISYGLSIFNLDEALESTPATAAGQLRFSVVSIPEPSHFLAWSILALCIALRRMGLRIH